MRLWGSDVRRCEVREGKFVEPCEAMTNQLGFGFAHHHTMDIRTGESVRSFITLMKGRQGVRFAINSCPFCGERIDTFVERQEGDAHCFDCRRPYLESYGFVDLVLPPAAWAAIAPMDGEGLLCPSCIVARLHRAGIRCKGEWRSGPLVEGEFTITPEMIARGESVLSGELFNAEYSREEKRAVVALVLKEVFHK